MNAFTTVLEEFSYKDAEVADRQIKQRLDLRPLHSIPFSIKDMFCAKRVRCTAGSRIMFDYISEIDATSLQISLFPSFTG